MISDDYMTAPLRMGHSLKLFETVLKSISVAKSFFAVMCLYIAWMTLILTSDTT